MSTADKRPHSDSGDVSTSLLRSSTVTLRYVMYDERLVSESDSLIETIFAESQRKCAQYVRHTCEMKNDRFPKIAVNVGAELFLKKDRGDGKRFFVQPSIVKRRRQGLRIDHMIQRDLFLLLPHVHHINLLQFASVHFSTGG